MTNGDKKHPEPKQRYAWPPPVLKKSYGSPVLKRVWNNSSMCRAYVGNYIWPGSLTSLALHVGGMATVRFTDTHLLKPFKHQLMQLEGVLSPIGNAEISAACSTCISGISLFLLSLVFRRGMLRLLLSLRGWMYEGKPSFGTKIWGVLVTCLSGYKPYLYNCQSSLPRMPVPPLRTSVELLLESFEPIYKDDPKTMAELKQEAEQFLNGVGVKLQRALELKSWWSENFVSDWWEKYVYLMGRTPLPINSNYYVMDQSYWVPTHRQCSRAAMTVYHLLLAWESIVMEDMEPLRIRGTVPVCMEQYRKIFSTTRVPGEEMDELVHHSSAESQHIVVNRRGMLYKVDVVDKRGALVSPTALEKQLEMIVEDADAKYDSTSATERRVPALTANERTEWSRARTECFSHGVNKESLHWVESAILYLVLDTEQFSDLSSRASHLLTGQPGTYWFDKSVSVIVMNDGHLGLNCEHSLADAPVIGHLIEYALTYDILENYFTSDGQCKEPPLVKTTPASDIRSKPQLLQWEVTPPLEAAVSRACSFSEKNNNNLDLVLFDHTYFGKGVIKKCRISPDAFIQMALHTTFRKLHGHAALTYESSMTRLYKRGRTETVRSLTPEADRFVEGFLTDSLPSTEKQALLKKACQRHAVMYKDAMNGKGIDRHLFALYVAARGMNQDCQFLKRVLSIPWTMSTSQQPQQQISWAPVCSEERFKNQISPGGGFGPVAQDGYGVSYMVPGDHRIFFHVSSLRSTQSTDSNKFVETLRETLADMKKLYND